jgi:monothiol glutaredoxin
VYIGKEFVGGSDIMLEMHKNGELVKALNKNNIKSKVADAAAAK